ncbi:DUF6416 domain-containing protein [Streptomyces sp. rh34]|uniref:DUF6416 domain-containing protein n=1 Tax=Streptomyces sp. rh34 TaxID=2034272 RepID=UPI000BF066B5|nr:DUF6416 domain-containing protein [Streptomyces sp. rh34]
MITINLGSGIELRLAPQQAHAVLDQLRNQLHGSQESSPSAARPASMPLLLSDGHPMWDKHSGGGRGGKEWDLSSDLERAEALYHSAPPKVRFFLDLLMDLPGQLLDADEICERSEGRFTGRSSLSGALNGIARPHRESHRNYPFYWWKGDPSQYAMKPTVAELFRQARKRG